MFFFSINSIKRVVIVMRSGDYCEILTLVLHIIQGKCQASNTSELFYSIHSTQTHMGYLGGQHNSRGSHTVVLAS
jgi:hypothetical protein